MLSTFLENFFLLNLAKMRKRGRIFNLILRTFIQMKLKNLHIV